MPMKTLIQVRANYLKICKKFILFIIIFSSGQLVYARQSNEHSHIRFDHYEKI
jgi:hypothetical protein